jgi:hypothetical protein
VDQGDTEVIKVEFNNVKRDCEIFAQQVETNQILGTQILEGHDQQIRTLDFMLKEARMEIDAIQDQSQQIIAGATEEFANFKTRIENCEKEQGQVKVKQASLTITYNVLQKRMMDLEQFVKRGLPNYNDLRVITERVNEITDQTTGLTEAVAGAKFSNTMPEHRGRVERVQQWQLKTVERNQSISPITDSDVAQISGIKGGSGTDAGMEDPEPGPSRSRGPPPPPQGGTGEDPPPPPLPSIPPS